MKRFGNSIWMQTTAMALLVVAQWACTQKKESVVVTPPAAPEDKGWTFESTPVWADEFTGTGLPDNARWGYDVGGGGWGNNELQNYTQGNNVRQENGNLIIEARREPSANRNYSSTRLVSRGKGDWLYGRFEIRAKLPAGRGTWPAIWMLPTDWSYGDWPRSGEIDIMEHVGYDPNKVHISVHTDAYNHMKGTQKTSARTVPTALTEFHKYRVDWTPYAVRGYIDDVLLFEFVNEGKTFAQWPFDKRFHLILNIAVGGNWGGVQGVDDNAFPAKMEVDYVRVYKMIDK